MRSKLLMGIVIAIQLFGGAAVLADEAKELTDDLKHAPASQYINNVRYVPVDILENHVNWVVSADFRTVSVKAKLQFQVSEAGRPYFLMNSAARVRVNGVRSNLVRLTEKPFEKSEFNALSSVASPGQIYVLEAEYVFFTKAKDTHFLPLEYWRHSHVEKGIPCNTHQDHFPLTLSIDYQGDAETLQILTNAEVSKRGKNQFFLRFPESLTSASFYIDMEHTENLVQKATTLTSIDGREIPVLVYSKLDDKGQRWVSAFRDIIVYSFDILEDQFGPFPYDKIIFNSTEKEGGGAYAGAMALGPNYLDAMIHELGHSWFSHSVSPASGHDHWIYEGLGHWAPVYRPSPTDFDKNYEKFADLTEDPLSLWKPDWRPFDGHLGGSAMLATLDRKIRDSETPFQKKGLIGVLKVVHERMRGKTMSTDQFRILLKEITGLSFDAQFEYYFLNYNRWNANSI